MKSIAIITARGGSKRIPRKNIKLFLGKPIIAYSIEAALNSRLFSEVMVSTDDEEIAEMAMKYGAHIPFLRSDKNADDFASTVDVIIEVLNEYEKSGQTFNYACCIYPTAPFVSEAKLKEAFNLLAEKNFSAVFPIARFSYPIQRALRLNNGNVSMIHPENLTARSQDLEPAYHDAGQYYWMDVRKFAGEKTLFMKNTGAIPTDEMEVQDIDNETDWKLAELKFQLMNRA